ncbi:MAG: hypothetical protein K2Y21_05415 [Phycisphaerales bacterium]|nr:hypothetical protein [Phycisphaerales bacterium]
MRSKFGLAASVIALSTALGAGAQVGPAVPPSAPDATEIDARLAALAKAYRSGPIRESVTIRVKSDRGQNSQATINLGADAGAAASGPGHDGRPRLIRLELSQLLITVEASRVIASLQSDPTRYAEFSLPDEPLKQGLDKLFPSLTLPQLVLADRAVPPTAAGLRDLGLVPGGARDVRWTSSRVDRGSGRFVLEGEFDNGTMKISIDRTSGRLRSAEVAMASGSVRSIDLSVRSVDLGDPSTWRVETTSRTRVDSLNELKSDADAIRVGQKMPKTLVFWTTGGGKWEESSDQFSSVLIMTRFDTQRLRESNVEERDATFREYRRTLLPAIKLRDQLLVGAKDRYSARCVALIDEADLTFDQAAILFRLFDTEDNLSTPNAINETVMLPETAIDMDPVLGGSLAAAIVLDKQRVVRGIVTLDDPTTAEKRVREILDASLSPAVK